MRCDGTGALWISSRQHGLFILSADGAHYQLYTEAEGLARREVQLSYEDREGNIWVGGWRGGLDRLRQTPFQTIAAAAGIGSENIYSLAPAREGGVWIGTHSRGVFLWRQGKTYLHEGAGGRSWAVLEDHAGSFWDGIYDGDLRRLTLTEMERFYSPEGRCHPYTFALFEDRAGRVWAGGDWGLSCYDHGRMSDFLPPLFDKAQFEWVNSFAEDNEGAIWLGTKLGFLHRLQNGAFTTFLKSTKDTQFPVCALYFRRPGELWLARFGFGLSRLKDGQLTDYTPAHGLPTSTINGLLDDARGFLWLTSKQGVFRIAMTEFDAFADHKTAGVRWEHFTKKDGLPSLACQGEQNKPSLCQTADGRIWIPTLQGVGVINPATLPAAGLTARALIEKVMLYRAGQPAQTLLDEGEFDPATPGPSLRFTVPSRKNNLVIHYTGIDLVDPKGVQFKYRLAGLDSDWLEGETSRTAVYAALPRGDYRFELIAINRRGVPSPPATFALQVLPAWWETWTFRALLAAIFLLSGPLYYLRRINHLNREREKQAEFTRRLIAREEAERKRIAHEIHDVLGHDLLLLKNSAARMDPYGRGVVVPPKYSRQAAAQPGDNAATAMKSVVADPSAYDWEGDEPLRRPSAQTIIYEMHVARLHPPSQFRRRGSEARHLRRPDREDSLPPGPRHHGGRTVAGVSLRRPGLSAGPGQLLGLRADLLLRAAPGLQLAPGPARAAR